MNIPGFAKVLLAAATLTLAACGSRDASPAKPPPLAGASIGGPFTLVDQTGRTVTERDFAGRYRIMYFGYTFCPDVCPTDAQAIGAGLKLFEGVDPAAAAKVVPVFVTVDPARDTPAVLHQFVSAFSPRMVGLTGSQAEIDRVAKEYAVYHQKGDSTPGGGYLVNHSRQAYLMGPDGRPIALLPQDEGAKAVAAALAQWVR